MEPETIRNSPILFEGEKKTKNSVASLTQQHNYALGYSINVWGEIKVAEMGII